jgi:hypothetical protein
MTPLGLYIRYTPSGLIIGVFYEATTKRPSIQTTAILLVIRFGLHTRLLMVGIAGVEFCSLANQI